MYTSGNRGKGSGRPLALANWLLVLIRSSICRALKGSPLAFNVGETSGVVTGVGVGSGKLMPGIIGSILAKLSRILSKSMPGNGSGSGCGTCPPSPPTIGPKTPGGKVGPADPKFPIRFPASS